MLQLDLPGTAVLSTTALLMQWSGGFSADAVALFLTCLAMYILWVRKLYARWQLQRRIDRLDRHLTLANLIHKVEPLDTPFMQRRKSDDRL